MVRVIVMGLRLALALLVALVLSAPKPAMAQDADKDEVITRITPEDFVTILNKAGFYSEVKTQDKGGKFIQVGGFFIGGAAGILFDQCEADGGCAIAVFLAYFREKQNDDWLNAWNQRNPGLVKASMQENLLRFDMSVHLFGGVSRNYLKQSAFAFVALVNQRKQFKP